MFLNKTKFLDEVTEYIFCTFKKEKNKSNERERHEKFSDAVTFMQNHQARINSKKFCCKDACLASLNFQTMFEARQQFKTLSLEKQREWILHFFHSMPSVNQSAYFLNSQRICQAAWQFVYGISNWR